MKTFLLILLLLCTPFLVLSQQRYNVVIDEIMADPSPQVGLPDKEWIELKNVSSLPINLTGWRFGDLSGQSGAFPDLTLQPDSFLILCSSNALAPMSAFGTAISVTNFPSLDNNGDEIFIRDGSGFTVDAVSYSDSWYQNELKQNGGWSLEMIDTKSPCEGRSNWKASIDSRGGTPGLTNSVDGLNPDQTPPKLKYAIATDSITVLAIFDKSLDSVKAATITNYKIDGTLSLVSATAIAPSFNKVQLTVDHSLAPNVIYDLSVNGVTDCGNNAVGPGSAVRVGLPAEAAPGDVVINEILYNPKPGEFDYVEFYNKSNKIVDASKLYAANRNSLGDLSSIEQIHPTPFYIFPGDYFVITENAASLVYGYLVKNPDAVFELSSLPSYPDDGGDVILLNGQGAVVDEVKYSPDWQFKLLDNPEGVSLERIDPNDASQDPGNWQSAASTAGYGTPTYKNSQYKQTQLANAVIHISPKIFSPDNDGHDDVATVQYKLDVPGNVANITIFDAQGRPVRYLVKNATLEITGHWNWDGLDEQGNKLPVGVYILYTEIFDLRGKTQRFKNTVVLARKLN